MAPLLSPHLIGTSFALLLVAASLVVPLLSGCGGPAAAPPPAAAQPPPAEPTRTRDTLPTGPGQPVRDHQAAGTVEVPPLPAGPTELVARFAGAEACRTCHAKEYAAYRTSGHAHTLRPAAGEEILNAFRSKQKLVDPLLLATYTVDVQAGKPRLHAALTTGKPATLPARWVLGSGRQGLTYLLQDRPGGEYLESRTSYFTKRKEWNWTPGQHEPDARRNPIGRPLPWRTTLACFVCHSTALLVEEGEIHPERSIPNVGCERCHGPGKEHVRLARAGKAGQGIYKYGGASGATIMELCADCHRGSEIAEGAALENTPDLPRFAGTALAASRCFTETPGGLSCVKCHDPHGGISTRTAAYEKVCLSCHAPAKPKPAPCPVNPRAGCVGCHMPKRDIGLPGGLAFHTHWIRPYPDLR